MKFLVLIRWYEEHHTVLNKWKWAEEKGGEEAVWDLPEGVKIGESGLLFGGPYNLAMFFTAEKEEQAFKFLKELEPFGRVERYLTFTCDWCENTIELQEELA